MFKDHLENISAEIVAYDSIKKLESYIPEFVSITWLNDKSETNDFLKEKEMSRLEVVREMFSRRTLPTALETVNLTFYLSGLTLGAVTHIIRHRMFSFSAQSTDPRSAAGDSILLSQAFEEVGLQKDAIKLLQASNDLYERALEKGLSYYDARNYLPRAKEAKYFMSGNISQFIAFINTRLGRTNQPYEDNILALSMRQAILEKYPEVADILAAQMVPEAPQRHYLSAINEKFNMNTFPPDELHRGELEAAGIDYSNAKFNHDKPRTEYPGFEQYEAVFNRILNKKKKLKIYVAGGWFSPDMLSALKDIEEAVFYNPLYNSFKPRVDNLGTEDSNWDDILQRNIDELEECDYMIASTVGKDIGTMTEVGRFQQMGKPVIFYAPGLKGPFNLMLAKDAHRVCTTFEDLLDAVEDITIKKEYNGEIE